MIKMESYRMLGFGVLYNIILWWSIQVSVYVPVVRVSYFPTVRKIFFFIFSFRMFNCDMAWHGYFVLSCLHFVWLLKSVGFCPFLNVRGFFVCFLVFVFFSVRGFFFKSFFKLFLLSLFQDSDEWDVVSSLETNHSLRHYSLCSSLFSFCFSDWVWMEDQSCNCRAWRDLYLL